MTQLGARVTAIEPGSVGSDMQPCGAVEQREAVANSEMLFAEEVAVGIPFVLTLSQPCDLASLRS